MFKKTIILIVLLASIAGCKRPLRGLPPGDQASQEQPKKKKVKLPDWEKMPLRQAL